MPNNRDIQKAAAKYRVAIDKNISESEILWSRYNAMLVFNTLLITTIGFVFQNQTIGGDLLLLLPILGLISCLVWFTVTRKGFIWINYWIYSARKLEEEYFKDNNEVMNPILHGDEHRKLISSWPNTEISSYILIVMIVLVYIAFLLLQISKSPMKGCFPLPQYKINHSQNF